MLPFSDLRLLLVSRRLLVRSFFTFLLVVGIGITLTLASNQQQLKSNAQTAIELVNSADINGDGKINILDYTVLFENFGKTVQAADRTGVVNVKSFGAKGDGYQDDTQYIQNAIDAAQADPRSPGKVFFPKGVYIISSLNLTKHLPLPVRLEGESMSGVQLRATNQTQSMPIIDASGSQYLEISNISIIGVGRSSRNTFVRYDGGRSGVSPTVGVLVSAASQNGSIVNSTKTLFTNVFVYGEFTKAAFYNYGSCCSSYISSHFQSFTRGVPAVVLTTTNTRGVVSPYVTLPTGKQGLVDHTFIAAEIHDLSNIYGEGSAPQSPSLILEDTPAVHFTGGVMSSCGESIVQLEGSTRNITFDGTSLVKNAEGAGCTLTKYGIYNKGRNDGLVINNTLNEGFQEAVVGGSPASGFFGLTLTGSMLSDYYATQAYKLISIEGTDPNSWKLVNSVINANGMDISVGGAVVRTKIMNPGAVSTPNGATRDITN